MFSVFKKINSFAYKWKTLDVFAIFLARYLPYILVIILFFYALSQNNYYIFIYSLVCGLFSRFIINEIVNLFYKESRPAQIEGTKILIPVPKNYSFPSGHASFFFGVSFFLLPYNLYLSLFFVSLSFLVGIARVFCGVHWFRDILAGAVAGGISAIVLYKLISFL